MVGAFVTGPPTSFGGRSLRLRRCGVPEARRPFTQTVQHVLLSLEDLCVHGNDVEYLLRFGHLDQIVAAAWRFPLMVKLLPFRVDLKLSRLPTRLELVPVQGTRFARTPQGVGTTSATQA